MDPRDEELGLPQLTILARFDRCDERLEKFLQQLRMDVKAGGPSAAQKAAILSRVEQAEVECARFLDQSMRSLSR